MRRGAQLLLCHEILGVGGEARHAEDLVTFSRIRLASIRDGIYSRVSSQGWRVAEGRSFHGYQCTAGSRPPSEEASKPPWRQRGRRMDGWMWQSVC